MIGQARGPRAARHAAPQNHRLREGLSFCFVAGHAVFLDLPADRYFCLGPSHETAFRAWLSGKADLAAVALLRAQRLLEPASNPADRFAPVDLPPATSSLLDSPTRAPLAELGRAGAHLMLSALRLKRGGLAWSIAHLRRRKSRICAEGAPEGAVPIARAARIASAHETAGLVFSSHDKCLWRSLAIAAHLARAGIAAELVIGVRLRPFRAHSWIRLGEIAVNDTIENLRTFTPILVV